MANKGVQEVVFVSYQFRIKFKAKKWIAYIEMIALTFVIVDIVQ